MRTSALLLLLLPALACTAAPPQERQRITSRVCTPTENLHFDTAGWIRVEDRDFSLSLPPGLREVEVQPIDSHVRVWRDPEGIREFRFDYGQFSDPLVPWTAEEATPHACESVIGGYGVRLVTGHDPGGGVFVAGAWRNVRPGTHLTLWGIAADTTQQRQLALILHSIDFHLQGARPQR